MNLMNTDLLILIPYTGNATASFIQASSTWWFCIWQDPRLWKHDQYLECIILKLLTFGWNFKLPTLTISGYALVWNLITSMYNIWMHLVETLNLPELSLKLNYQREQNLDAFGWNFQKLPTLATSGCIRLKFDTLETEQSMIFGLLFISSKLFT